MMKVENMEENLMDILKQEISEDGQVHGDHLNVRRSKQDSHKVEFDSDYSDNNQEMSDKKSDPDFKYSDKKKVTARKENKINPKNSVKCDLCEKTFSCKKNMVKHKIIHTGVKPFKCDLCEMR